MKRVADGLAEMFGSLWMEGKSRKPHPCCLDGRRGKPSLTAEHTIGKGEASYRLMNPDALTPTFGRPDRICAACVAALVDAEPTSS